MARGLRYLALALLLAASLPLHAEHEDRYFIDRLVVQYAGLLGMVSLGVENTAGEHADFQLLAGYTPASEAGIDIYALGLKASYVFDPILRIKTASASLYSGIGLYYYFGEQYTDYKYPDGYYSNPYSEWHLMPYIGMKLTGHDVRHSDLTLYAEVGILDAYLVHYYNNYQTISLSDAINIAIGVSLPLR